MTAAPAKCIRTRRAVEAEAFYFWMKVAFKPFSDKNRVWPRGILLTEVCRLYGNNSQKAREEIEILIKNSYLIEYLDIIGCRTYMKMDWNPRALTHDEAEQWTQIYERSREARK